MKNRKFEIRTFNVEGFYQYAEEIMIDGHHEITFTLQTDDNDFISKEVLLSTDETGENALLRQIGFALLGDCYDEAPVQPDLVRNELVYLDFSEAFKNGDISNEGFVIDSHYYCIYIYF